jgi:hypothetical protein
MKLATAEQVDAALDEIFRDVGGGSGFLMRPVPSDVRVRFIGGPLDEARMRIANYLPELRWAFDEQHPQLEELVIEYAAIYWPSLFAPNTYALHRVVRVGSRVRRQIFAPADAHEGLMT